jgi:MoaA/NifB/PqqE/SkfB family radical SAM enzyme
MKIKEIKNGTIENMIIEITRNCNFKCSHCLRGETQNKNIELHKLRMFLYENEVKCINSLTITGGEPLMYPELIETLALEIRMMHLDVNYVYIATNGSYFNLESFEALNSLYNSINEGIHLEISNSIYHQEERKKLNLKIETDKDILYSIFSEKLELEYEEEYSTDSRLEEIGYLFSQEDFVISLDSRKYNNLISEGRGSAIGGFNEAEEIEDMIYYSAKGEIVLGKCDLSFKSIRKEKIKLN